MHHSPWMGRPLHPAAGLRHGQSAARMATFWEQIASSVAGGSVQCQQICNFLWCQFWVRTLSERSGGFSGIFRGFFHRGLDGSMALQALGTRFCVALQNGSEWPLLK